MPPNDRNDPGRGAGRSRYPGAFRQAFQEALAGMGWQARRWRDDLVDCTTPDGEERTLGVENLYRRLRRAGRDERSELITEFVRNVSSVGKDAPIPDDLASAADRLLPRVGQPFAIPRGQPRPWAQPLGETELAVSLVFDFPQAMAYVNEDSIAESGRPAAEWLERAVANLRAQTPADSLELLDEDAGVHLCTLNDCYAAARALILDHWLLATPAGCLVAVPNRDCLLVMPVALRHVPHFHLLKALAEKNHDRAPYAISPEVYWVRGGSWHPFRIEFKDRKVSLWPPAEFVGVLNALTGMENADGDGASDGAPPEA